MSEFLFSPPPWTKYNSVSFSLLDHIDSETLQKYMEACEKKRKESLPD